MPASIYWSVGHIRAGEHHFKYGDPYESCGTIMRVGDIAYILAWVGPPAAFKIILEALVKEGITAVEWERKTDKGNRLVHIDISRYHQQSDTNEN